MAAARRPEHERRRYRRAWSMRLSALRESRGHILVVTLASTRNSTWPPRVAARRPNCWGARERRDQHQAGVDNPTLPHPDGAMTWYNRPINHPMGRLCHDCGAIMGRYAGDKHDGH